MKRSKILVSMFTLFVAILGLCFGVYAALKISYNVSGTVNYQVSHAKVEITTQLYHSSYKANSSLKLKTDMVDVLKTKTVQEISEQNILELKESGLPNIYNSETDADGKNEVDELHIKYEDSNALSYFIVVSIKNLDTEKSAYARIIDEIIEDNINSFVYISEGYASIQPEQTKSIVLGFGLNDKRVNVKESEFFYKIEVGSGVMPTNLEIVDPDGSLNDSNPTVNGDEYYGVKMGYITESNSQKTHIYWRLISIDNGITPYVFNKDIIPVGMAVFVMETPVSKEMSFHNQLNDYSISQIRAYMNAKMLQDIKIGSTNEVLATIRTKSLYSMYKNNKISQTQTDIVYSDAEFLNSDYFDYKERDKFYLLSLQETLNLLGGLNTTNLNDYNSNVKANCAWNNSNWWVRSVQDDKVVAISADGSFTIMSVSDTANIRPAFNAFI